MRFSSSDIEIADFVDVDFKHYLYTLLKAIEFVDYEKYVSNAGNHAISDDISLEKKIGELLERTFAYELYRHAFQIIMNGTTNYPDLILHKSHNNIKRNTFVCEIKRKEGMRYEDVVHDISKLCVFLSHQIWNDNPYKYGFFIVIRDKLDSIKRILESRRQSNEYVFYAELKKNKIELFKRIICISYNEEIITYDTLYNLLIIENK